MSEAGDPGTHVDPVDALVAGIGWPHSDAERAVRDQLTGHGLGRLVELGAWLAGTQAAAPPRAPARPRMITVSVGPDPDPLTAELADSLGVGIRVVHAPGPATDAEAVTAAVDAGAAAVDAEVDAGADLLLLADPNGADEVAVLTAISLITSAEPVRVVGTSGGRSDADWMRAVAELRDLRRRVVAVRSQPLALWAGLGSAPLAVQTGMLLHAAARRTPVVLDGPATAAAALLAREASARAIRWWAAGHRGADIAHALALERLHLEPVVDLALDRPSGLGALLALGPLRAAVAACAAARMPETEPETESETEPETEPAPEPEPAPERQLQSEPAPEPVRAATSADVGLDEGRPDQTGG
ncbi:MAG: nicotinate-nucleotide--dimethylbenzimidazole phosphoribosyltransferase [bacterium]